VYTTSTSRARTAMASKYSPSDLAKMWIESIAKEDSTRKQWETMYGWMRDLDAKVFV